MSEMCERFLPFLSIFFCFLIAYSEFLSLNAFQNGGGAIKKRAAIFLPSIKNIKICIRSMIHNERISVFINDL